VVITDGENHVDDALGAAEHAAENKVPVYCIGVGTVEGAPIPIYEGRNRIDYKKDRNGNVVVTRLNETEMAKVAASGKGLYISATAQDLGVETIVKELDKQTRTELDSVVYVDYEDRFQWFIGAALLLLCIETVLTEKRSKWVDRINWFNA
jgi:Ca-activated chloride channel family protein